MAQGVGVGRNAETSLNSRGGALYASIETRIVEVHRPGIFSAPGNVLWNFTQGPEGPAMPPVCENVVCVHVDEAVYSSWSIDVVHIAIPICVLRATGS